MITEKHKSKQCTNIREFDLCPWLTKFPSGSLWASLYSVFYAHNAQLNKQDFDLWPWPTLFPKKQFMSQPRPCDLYTQLPNTQEFDLWPQLTLFPWNSWWPVELVGPRTPSPRWGTSCPPPARGGRKTVRGGWSRRYWGTGKVLGRGSLDRLKPKEKGE